MIFISKFYCSAAEHSLELASAAPNSAIFEVAALADSSPSPPALSPTLASSPALAQSTASSPDLASVPSSAPSLLVEPLQALSKQGKPKSRKPKVAATVPADANGSLAIFDKPLLLTPLSPEIIQNQATINVGTIGDVSHGKSTVVRALTGIKTTRFKEELERNITIKLGYANAKLYKCDNPDCPAPGNFKSFGASHHGNPLCERLGCNSSMSLQRHVSFVDCPGHDRLMVLVLLFLFISVL
jgi:hypothetical protein